MVAGAPRLVVARGALSLGATVPHWPVALVGRRGFLVTTVAAAVDTAEDLVAGVVARPLFLPVDLPLLVSTVAMAQFLSHILLFPLAV